MGRGSQHEETISLAGQPHFHSPRPGMKTAAEHVHPPEGQPHHRHPQQQTQERPAHRHMPISQPCTTQEARWGLGWA